MKQSSVIIKKCLTRDIRFDLKNGDGSDAINQNPQYAYAVCNLTTEGNLTGTGFALTLGTGNELVCQAIEYLKTFIEGKEIEELMSDFGQVFQEMSNAPNLRWLGPHKGIIHLALASVTNACFDLWAKSRKVPLWKLLIDLSPEEVVNILDLSYITDVLNRSEVIEILKNSRLKKSAVGHVLKTGYRGYDTSAGWFNYSNFQIQDKVKQSVDQGFTALKLKVGSDNHDRDIERAHLVREAAGDSAQIMLDANQRWSLAQAVEFCQKLNGINPYWIEEPTHPDDVNAHVELAKKIKPVKLAMGEHIPNRVIFKNFLQSRAMSFNQVDAVRVGGISEFITISLMSKKFNVPVVPHVGDMGQIHQHLVLFNQICVGHDALFLEYIPHLRNYFKFPAHLIDGYYQVPQEPGASTDFN
jgi:L-fuconate dehydratase